jgi:transposase
VLIAEIGVDMDAFPTPEHLASWAGVCPGNDESAGKRRSGKIRKGSKWLRATLTESANAAARTKDCYLAAQYQRLRGRRGHSKAVTAVGHSSLTAAIASFAKAPTASPDDSSASARRLATTSRSNP